MTTRIFSAMFSLLAVVAHSEALRGQERQSELQAQSVWAIPGTPGCVAPQPPPVRLGLMAYDTYGYVEVASVNYGSAASRLGLEAGDRILEINGHAVRTGADLRQLVQEAVVNHGGQVRVLIDNVRARHGECGAQRYVTNQTWLDGFRPWPQPGMPQPYFQSGTPIAQEQPRPVPIDG
jgi:membrane-associated protease RseP (regulator of RpoE activity)